MKGDIASVIETAKTALGGLLGAAQGVGNFVISNMDTLLPLAVNVGKAYAMINLLKVVHDAGKAAAAFGVLTKAKLLDKAQTIYLQALYAKDAVIRGASTAATVAQTAATTAWNVAAGAATVVTTALGAAFRFMTGPVGIAITVIMALIGVGVLLYKNWDPIKVKALELWEKLKAVFSGIKDAVVSKARELWEGMKEIFGGIKETISGALKGAANAGIGAYSIIPFTAILQKKKAGRHWKDILPQNFILKRATVCSLPAPALTQGDIL